MSSIIAERELISHLTPLVGNEDAINMVNDYKKEVIEEFVKKLKKNNLDLEYPYYMDDEIFKAIAFAKWDEVK